MQCVKCRTFYNLNPSKSKYMHNIENVLCPICHTISSLNIGTSVQRFNSYFNAVVCKVLNLVFLALYLYLLLLKQ